jgi:hypothetical protein
LDDTELRALARQLGAGQAERLDLEKTAAAVVHRLRTERPRAERAHPLRTWLSLAAALVLLLGGGLVWQRGRHGQATASIAAPAGLDLSTLSADQLHDLLNAVDQPLEDDPAGSSDTGIDDLTPSELRTLLGALEG